MHFGNLSTSESRNSSNIALLKYHEKQMKKRLLLLTTILLFFKLLSNSQIPAFPGADGFARYTTTGGRGGEVYHVTNLNDSGSGSLRDAVSKSNRIIVFDVAGIIELESSLKISKDNITIAGQTAPGNGICLRNHTLQVNANNIIIRFIRCRMGDEKQAEDDAMWGRRFSNIIIDHCTMSWSTDECSSFYDNTNFTMQWCILSESLRNSVHGKGKHGYGGIWGGKGASFHHNLLAHHDSRNPRFCGSRYSNQPALELVDFRNNVIYNWGANSGYAGEGGSYNIISNYYKYGPATKSSVRYRIFEPYADSGDNSQAKGVYGKFFVTGNYVDGSGSTTTNNWDGMHLNTGSMPSGTTKNDLRSDTEFGLSVVTTHSANEAFNKVLAYAGASLARDLVDERIVNETRNRSFTYTGSNGSTNGLIDSQSNVGDWPAYTFDPAEVLTDSDRDGIPDVWETANGLNPHDPDDSKKLYKDGSGYTNIEVYINSLVEDIMKEANEDAENDINEYYPPYSKPTTNIPENRPSTDTFAYRNGNTICIKNLEGINNILIYNLNGALLNSFSTQAKELEFESPISVIIRITSTIDNLVIKVF